MRPLLKHLVSVGAVTPDDMEQAVRAVGERRAERELLATGKLRDVDLARTIAALEGVPYIDLLTTQVDEDAVALVSPELARRHYVLPIAVEDGELTLAMVDPGDVIALDDVAGQTGLRVLPVVVTREAMGPSLDRYVRLDEQISDLTSELGEIATASATGAAAETLQDEEEGAPVVRFVNLIITQAIQDRASDIHIDPTDLAMRVRYRIDGVLHDVHQGPISIRDGVISRLKIMSGIDIAERRKPQDGRISVKHMGRAIDLRVVTLPSVWGEKIVLRILDNARSRMRLEDLDFSARNLEVFSRSYRKPHGMILVTGPTGSGKSTTLYTTLREVARPEVSVITVEDPVEHRMAGIAQMQVNPKAGLTFASALRSILRGDPDVVLVGEIRDAETAQTSIEAALTGHLVLSTMHTNDAPSAVTRLVEMGIEPFLVASALDTVIAQRLARRLCVECKVMREPDRGLLEKVGLPDPGPGVLVGEPQGCARCSNTGYRGRLALHEVMQVTESVQRLAVARASSREIRQLAIDEGMVTLREDGWQKVLAGVSSIEEILRVTV